MVLEFLVGYVGTRFGDSLLRALGGDGLKRDLDQAARLWSQKLPKSASLATPAALFPRVAFDEDLESRPALRAVRLALLGNRVPTRSDWTAALMEQWHYVKETIPEPADFFCQSAADAEAQLDDLAQRLVDSCSRNAALFQPTILDLLMELRVMLEAARAQAEADAPVPQLPIANLAIEWSRRAGDILPHYQDAMASGASWPGTEIERVNEEYKYCRLLKSLLQSIAPDDREALKRVEALQRKTTVDEEWHRLREELIDIITRLETREE